VVPIAGLLDLVEPPGRTQLQRHLGVALAEQDPAHAGRDGGPRDHPEAVERLGEGAEIGGHVAKGYVAAAD